MNRLQRTASIDFVMSESFVARCRTDLKNPAMNVAEWVAKDLQKRFTKKEWLEMEISVNIRPFDVLVKKNEGVKNCEIIFREQE